MKFIGEMKNDKRSGNMTFYNPYVSISKILTSFSIRHGGPSFQNQKFKDGKLIWSEDVEQKDAFFKYINTSKYEYIWK